MKGPALLAGLAVLAGCTPPPPTPAPARPVVQATDKVFDWRIEGHGYFVVQHVPGGEVAYTRSGAFDVAELGTVTLRSLPSWQLSPQVIVNPTKLGQTRLTPDGIVLQPIAAETPDLTPSDLVAGPVGLCSDCQALPAGWKPLGRLSLAVFAHPDRLTPRADGLYVVTDAAAVGETRRVTPTARPAAGDPGPWDQGGRIVQGFLETTTAAGLPVFPLPISLGLGRP